MKVSLTHSEELGFMVQLIEHRGTTAYEDFEYALGPYLELKDDLYETIAIMDFIALQIFLSYVIYHLISKMRGNEKNLKMNNFGIGVAVLGLWFMIINVVEYSAYSVNPVKYYNWTRNHRTLYLWIWWSADSAYHLYHWLFNWRYVKSTFRLPVLEKSAEFHNKMLDRIFKQREEQHVLFSPQELEDHSREMAILKKRQGRQETWSSVIEILFLLLVIASSYPYVYGGSYSKV